MLVISWPSLGNVWWLVFFAFVPMLLAQYRFMPRRLIGLPVGVAFGGYWVGGFEMASAHVGIWPVIGATIVIGLLGWLIGAFDKRFAERTRYRWFIVQFPLVWVGIDVLLDGNLFSGSMSWIAYRLWTLPSLVQPISVVGTPALSFLLVMINGWIALLIITLIDGRRPDVCPQAIPRRVLYGSSIVVGVVLVVWIASSLVIFSSVHRDQGPRVTVAAVQPGSDYAPPLVRGWGSYARMPPADNEVRRDALESQLTSMTEHAAAMGAEFVVWPEEALDYDPRTTRTSWLPNLARSTHTYIVAGFVPHPELLGEGANMAGIWAPDGSLLGVFYKIHPVPAMGEWFQTPQIYQTYHTGIGPISMMICFDFDFPLATRLVTLTGAELVGIPSAGPARSARFRVSSLVFRAIENRTGYVKGDLAWESVIVGPDGVVRKRTAATDQLGEPALLVAEVNRGPRNSPYTSVGDIAGPLMLFFLGYRISWQVVYWRRTRDMRM
ncbi:hypothetical protein A5692_11550 [Mycobacterium sp. E342]|nr:hypothetical protein A5692_11550 [Mycobacterium sp. E342]